jgi:quercetin dioxygenase-like cupin family protein
MRRLVALLTLLLSACATTGPAPQSCAMRARSSADQPAWSDHPTATGVRIQYLAGHPREQGFFVYRLYFPAGFRLAPHTHSTALHSTVLCGGLLLGRGAQEDPARESRHAPGAFNVFPAGTPHWERVETDTILQVSGIGPVTTTPVPSP